MLDFRSRYAETAGTERSANELNRQQIEIRQAESDRERDSNDEHARRAECRQAGREK